jgi:hypothetical protein
MRRIIMAAAIGALLVAGQFGSGGVAEGAEIRRERVPAHSTHTYTRFFAAGEPVVIAVSGDRSTDLDLYADCPLHGQVIASDTGPGDDCAVRFLAPETGSYRIRVVNLGSVWNDYTILID